MFGKFSLLGKILMVFNIISIPYVVVALSARVAFSEWFIEWQYSLKSFPEDIYGMSKEERKRLAKIGLKAVLSEEGMEEFKNAKLPDGRRAFTLKETKHMEDVRRLLSVLFPLAYILSVFNILSLIYTFLKSKRLMGYILLWGGCLCILLLILAGIISVFNYEFAFEKFHDLFFDPYSWRFSYRDTLIRIYPKVFWFNGTIFVISISIFISLLFIIFGLFVKKKYS